jgi:uncharacterized protein YeaO (DUF488 family)
MLGCEHRPPDGECAGAVHKDHLGQLCRTHGLPPYVMTELARRRAICCALVASSACLGPVVARWPAPGAGLRLGRSLPRYLPMVKRKRVYLPPEATDGYRVLVDRLWPRGLSKAELRLDAWLKELGTSDELRAMFHHDPEHWATFASRFRRQLGEGTRPALLDDLARRARRGTVTLLFAARDEEHNNAVVIEQAIRERMARAQARTRSPIRAAARTSHRRATRKELPSAPGRRTEA